MYNGSISHTSLNLPDLSFCVYKWACCRRGWPSSMSSRSWRWCLGCSCVPCRPLVRPRMHVLIASSLQCLSVHCFSRCDYQLPLRTPSDVDAPQGQTSLNIDCHCRSILNHCEGSLPCVAVPYSPGGIVSSDIQKIVLTTVTCSYVRVPNCRALCAAHGEASLQIQRCAGACVVGFSPSAGIITGRRAENAAMARIVR